MKTNTDKQKSLEAKRRFIAKQRQLGLCLECTNRVKSNCTRCERCLARRQQKSAQNKQEAVTGEMCAICLHEPKIQNHRLCKKCYCKSVSTGRFKTTKHWQTLLEKFEAQSGRCAISGVQMTLGRDCELDHIVPESRGGVNTVENTQWTLMVCNRMKDNLLGDEFFGLIEQIYHAMKRKVGTES